MTLYEILSIATPVIVIISGGMISYVLKTITDSITRLDSKIDNVEDRLNTRMDKLDDRLGLVEKDLYFIKGLIEGKKSF